MGKKSWWGKPWQALGIALGWLLEGFNPLAEINFLVSSLGYRKQVGINHGRLERQKLDVYSPKGEARDLPVVVFFYGGSLTERAPQRLSICRGGFDGARFCRRDPGLPSLP